MKEQTACKQLMKIELRYYATTEKRFCGHMMKREALETADDWNDHGCSRRKLIKTKWGSMVSRRNILYRIEPEHPESLTMQTQNPVPFDKALIMI